MKTQSTLFGTEMSNETSIPTINAKELVEDEIRFKIQSVNIKENVKSKYFPEGHTVAFVVITIGGQPYLLAASQTVLLKKFAYVKDKLDAGDDSEFLSYIANKEFVIQYAQGKVNQYMDIFEVTEE